MRKIGLELKTKDSRDKGRDPHSHPHNWIEIHMSDLFAICPKRK